MKKSTDDLIREMTSSSDYLRFAGDNAESMTTGRKSFADAAAEVIASSGLSRAEVVRRSEIEQHYAYQILSGARRPARDKALMFCIGAGLSPEQTREFLKTVGEAPLWAKEKRDGAVLFALMKGLSVMELNEILYDLDLRQLS